MVKSTLIFWHFTSKHPFDPSRTHILIDFKFLYFICPLIKLKTTEILPYVSIWSTAATFRAPRRHIARLLANSAHHLVSQKPKEQFQPKIWVVGASGTGEPGVNELLGVSQKCMDKVAKGRSRQNCRLWASENCLIACHMVTCI